MAVSWRARVLIARLWMQRNKRFYADPAVMRSRLAVLTRDVRYGVRRVDVT